MRARGFTLIELMVGLAIFALLLLISMPTMIQFMGDSRIRNTADSITQGIRMAQVEAIRRNRDVDFVLTPASGWRVDDSAGGTLQSEPFTHLDSVSVSANPPGTSVVRFSGLGQFRDAADTVNPVAAPGPLQRIDVTSSTMASPHPLQVVADPSLGVGIRTCDPQFSSASGTAAKASIGCPP